MSLIATTLWPALHALEPASELGGIYANKRGYHNKRENLPADDYSVGQFAVDRQGPANEAGAIDWTFPDAQHGDYKTINKYSKRLYAARSEGDERTQYIREFFGNIDTDTEVEGWDFSKNRASTSDDSHLWHIHISIHRAYVNNATAMNAIISILKGESLATWQARTQKAHTMIKLDGLGLPELKYGQNDDDFAGYNDIWRLQKMLGIDADGDYGAKTAAAVKAYMGSGDGKTVGLTQWLKIYGISQL